jgi:hypothetical protein
VVAVHATGTPAASDEGDVQSPETYIGYGRAVNFVAPGGAGKDASHFYTTGKPLLNEWGLSGDWTIGEERAVLDKKEGSITYPGQNRIRFDIGSR